MNEGKRRLLGIALTGAAQQLISELAPVIPGYGANGGVVAGLIERQKERELYILRKDQARGANRIPTSYCSQVNHAGRHQGVSLGQYQKCRSDLGLMSAWEDIAFNPNIKIASLQRYDRLVAELMTANDRHPFPSLSKRQKRRSRHK